MNYEIELYKARSADVVFLVTLKGLGDILIFLQIRNLRQFMLL